MLETHGGLGSGSGSNPAPPSIMVNQKSRQKAGVDNDGMQNLAGLPVGSKANTYSHPAQVQTTASATSGAQILPAKQAQNPANVPPSIEGNGAIFQAKKRRSSNQGIQRANYTSSGA